MTEYKDISEMVAVVESYIYKKKGYRIKIDMDKFYNPFTLKRELYLLNVAYNVAISEMNKQ